MAAIEDCSTTIRAMGSVTVAVLTYIRAFFLARHRLALEAAALRQQLALFQAKANSTQARSPGPALLDYAAARTFRLD